MNYCLYTCNSLDLKHYDKIMLGQEFPYGQLMIFMSTIYAKPCCFIIDAARGCGVGIV